MRTTLDQLRSENERMEKAKSIHATVLIDGVSIPLIGVDIAATQQECEDCKSVMHISEIILDINGHALCKYCSNNIFKINSI